MLSTKTSQDKLVFFATPSVWPSGSRSGLGEIGQAEEGEGQGKVKEKVLSRSCAMSCCIMSYAFGVDSIGNRDFQRDQQSSSIRQPKKFVLLS